MPDSPNDHPARLFCESRNALRHYVRRSFVRAMPLTITRVG
jgi:hypothetical protein